MELVESGQRLGGRRPGPAGQKTLHIGERLGRASVGLVMHLTAIASVMPLRLPGVAGHARLRRAACGGWPGWRGHAA